MKNIIINKNKHVIRCMRLAQVASEFSDDPFKKVGCCILRQDHSVASIWFNGPPPWIEINRDNRDERRKWIVHWEMNALRFIKPWEGYILACTLLPCSHCINVIASYWIKKVFYWEDYNNDLLAIELCVKYWITLIKRSDNY